MDNVMFSILRCRDSKLLQNSDNNYKILCICLTQNQSVIHLICDFENAVALEANKILILM
jgi:hypothetical protein